MGERVCPGVTDLLVAWLRAANKIALLFGGIAPRAARVPMPCLNHQFRVLTIGYSLPSPAQKLLEDWIGQHPFGMFFVLLPGGATTQTVNPPTECSKRTERIHDVRRSHVYHDILRACRDSRPKEQVDTKIDSQNAPHDR